MKYIWIIFFITEHISSKIAYNSILYYFHNWKYSLILPCNPSIIELYYIIYWVLWNPYLIFSRKIITFYRCTTLYFCIRILVSSKTQSMNEIFGNFSLKCLEHLLFDYLVFNAFIDIVVTKYMHRKCLVKEFIWYLR